MPFISFGNLPDTFRFVETVSFDQLRSGIITAQEIVIAGGTRGILRSQNFSTGEGWSLRGDGNATFGRVRFLDGTAQPAVVPGEAAMFVDTLDGSLKIRFGDGTVTTIASPGGAPPPPPPPPPGETNPWDLAETLDTVGGRGPANAPALPAGLTTVTTADNWQAKVDTAGAGGRLLFKAGTYSNFSVKPYDNQEWYGENGTIFDGTGTTANAVKTSANRGNNWLIRGIEIKNYTVFGIHTFGVSNTEISYCNVHDCDPAPSPASNTGCIHLGSNSGHVVKFCIVSKGGEQNIRAGALNQTIEDNEISWANTSGIAWQNKAGGVKMHSVGLTHARRNWCHDNDGPDLWWDANPNAAIECVDNLCEDGVDGPGIMYEISSGGALIARNVLRNIDHAAMNVFESEDAVIEENLFDNCSSSITSREGTRSQILQNCIFRLNTVINQPSSGSIGPYAAGVWTGSGEGPLTWEDNTYTLPSALVNAFRIGGATKTVAQWEALYPTENITVV